MDADTNANANANTNANADAGGITVGLRELRSGELKMKLTIYTTERKQFNN